MGKKCEKPILLAGVRFDDALLAAMQTPPMPKKKKPKK